MNIYVLCALAVVTLVTTPLSGQTKAVQLQLLTAQLQQSPADQPLRERIIALALTFNPSPATPDAAITAEGAAEYAFKTAKADSDFSDAAKQYEKALLIAPWLAADYFNCGVAHEKAGENQEAIRNFGFYLLAAPNAVDAVAVKKRIGGLLYAVQKASDPATIALAEKQKYEQEVGQAQQEFAALILKLDGAIFLGREQTDGVIQDYELRIHKAGENNHLQCSLRIKTIQSNDPQFPVTRAFKDDYGQDIVPTSESEFRGCASLLHYRISPDARTLYGLSGGDVFQPVEHVEITYYRQ